MFDQLCEGSDLLVVESENVEFATDEEDIGVGDEEHVADSVGLLADIVVVVWKIFLKTIKERDAVHTNSVTYLNEITFEFEKTLHQVRSQARASPFSYFPNLSLPISI